MATAKKTGKDTGGKKTPAGRKKSKLTLAGEATQRGMLLQALKDTGWNLTRAAEALEMAGPADVLRSIKGLGLSDEYEGAKGRGEAKPGRPAKD